MKSSMAKKYDTAEFLRRAGIDPERLRLRIVIIALEWARATDAATINGKLGELRATCEMLGRVTTGLGWPTKYQQEAAKKP